MDPNALLTQNKQALLAIKELKAQLARSESRARAPIAIVGMGCRFPGGCASPAQLWELLRDGRDAVGEASPARWPADLYDADPATPGKIMTKGLGVVERAAEFEPEFFHVSPREAASIDPQHRLLLEVAWEACEDAGLPRERLHGSRTGIFVGAGNNDYGDFELRNPDLGAISAYAGTGNTASLAAGRLAFFLGTQGPALVIDTACSSSLVAVHQACTSLRQGESELALAGGINLILSPNGSVFLSRIGALSPTGRCRAFAEAADGYVRADGCAVIALKRLDDAQRDGDRIYAVIRGSAVNHDGRSGGLTVPNGAAQRALLHAALANAEVAPERISYLEAHGTGTPLGDPIEMGAIAAVFGAAPRGEPLRVGSVKSNLGHTEAAAGIAGLVKAVLCLQHRAIPAHLHFAQPSSRIDWNIPVEVPTRLAPWPGDTPRLAGVSSFGFSGTNAHVVLEEAPLRAPAHSARTATQLLCLSARHDTSLARLASAYRDRLREDGAPPLADLCHAAARRRTHHGSRLAVLGADAAAIAQALDDFLDGTHHRDAIRGDAVLDAMSTTAFVFSGQGSQWIGMGSELLAREPVFERSLRAMDAALGDELGGSLIQALLEEPAVSQLDRTRIAQPVLVAVQIALADLWRSWGIVPDAVLGHSLGEITAAHVAGVLDRSTALRLACLRGRVMDEATGRGQMAELACTEDVARGYLRGFEADVSIAAINGPSATVIAGASAALAAILPRVAADAIQHRMLRVNYAFHSPQMVEFGPRLARAVADLQPQRAACAIYSSVLGGAIRGEEMTAAYWAKNITEPVRFHDALVALLGDGCRAIVEVAPHPVLLSAIQAALAGRGVEGVAVGSLRRGAPECRTLLANLGALYAAGAPVDWSAIYPGVVDHVALPVYPWHERRFWTGAVRSSAVASAPSSAGVEHGETTAPAKITSKLWAELVEAGPAARSARLERHVRAQLSRVLDLDPGEPVPKRTLLSDLGMDSVGAIQLAAALALAPDHTVAPTVLFDHPTIDGVIEFLAGEFARLHAPAETAPRAPAGRPEIERAIAEPIAIIGMGCRLPGGVRDPESYWQFLKAGANGVRDTPPDRWALERYYDPEPGVAGRMYTGHGGFLDRVDGFDAEFFGIAPREAQSMDPQQRIFLETCWEAVENAGLAMAALDGSQTGVYAGIVNQDYAMMQMKDTAHEEMDTYFATGHPHCVVSGRVAYQFGFRGPTLSVDTACSSSLVALHLACQSLRLGSCDLALAGGINLLLMPEIYMIRCQARMLSPSGRCATFDAAADGYIPGEGCGVVVLKRLGDALRDGDRIDAVIRGTQINHDGRSNGLTVPSGGSQRELMRAALRDARVEPARIGYVEAHGTGTALGDPIEMAGIQDVYCADRAPDQPLVVGSVKTNFGHLESAAGISGLIKAVLALKHGEIPRHLHFSALNPHIALHPSVRIPTEHTAWPATGSPRCAAVSSFGMSGTNAHAILEEAPPAAQGSAASASPQLVALGAHHPESLRAASAQLVEYIDAHPALSLDDLVHTLARRSAHRQRLAFAAGSIADVRARLAAVTAGEPDPRVVQTDEIFLADPKLVFVFPGQGSQWVGMGHQLLEREPEFAAELADVDAWIQRFAGWSVLAELRADASASRLDRVDVIQPCIFAVQVALARLWRSWGVAPSAVVGHSMGEVAAAYVAGVLSLEDAVCIITRRSQIVKSTSGHGAMAMVELTYEQALEAIAAHPTVAVAAHNGPHSVLLSGTPGSIAQILGELQQRDVFCRAVKVDYASHSPQMDALGPALRDALAAVAPRSASVAFYSTVTGRVEDGRAHDAAYWVRNLRDPVRFWPVIQQLAEDGHNVFLEISPHPVLVPSIAQGLAHARTRALSLPSLHRDKPELDCLLDARARMFCAGGPLAVDERPNARALALPSYPWRAQRFWYTPSAVAARPAARSQHRLLHRAWASGSTGQRSWESDLGAPDLGTMPSLDDHRVNGMRLFPAAGYVELVLEAAAALGGTGQIRIDALEIREGLVIRDDQARVVQLEFAPTEGAIDDRTFRFLLSSREAGGTAWTRHADGVVTREDATGADGAWSLAAVRERLVHARSAEDHYLRCREKGLEYGPAYQAIQRIDHASDPCVGEALAELAIPAAIASELVGCQLHPSLLDAGFQLIDAALSGSSAVAQGEVYLPSALHGLRLHRVPAATDALHVHLCVADTAPQDASTLSAQLRIVDGEGAPILTIDRFVIRRVEPAAAWEGLPSEWFYQLRWQPLEESQLPRAAAAPDSAWLVFADDRGVAAALADRLASSGVRTTRVHKGTGPLSGADRAWTIDPSAPDSFRALFAAIDPAAFSRILYCWGLDARTLDDEPDALAPQLPETEALIELVQALSAREPQPSPQLWLITAGADPAAAAPLQAPLWAIGRVLEYEHPELKTVSCDLPRAISAAHVDRLAALLGAAAVPDQLRIADGVSEARLARYAPPAHAAPLALSDRGTYLVTGGLGGLGLRVAQQLVEHGARHLALVGRSQPSEHAQRAIRALEEQGARVRVFSADVAQRDELVGVFCALASGDAPLRGVVHCAGILRDGALLGLDRAQFRAVLDSKLAGTWNLHALTRDLPLDHFVLFSSVASLLGAPGQGNYAAANAFMDGVAAHRRARGLPALTIQWGAFRDVGLAAAAERRGDRLADSGIPGISPATGGKALEMALRWGASSLGVFPLPFLLWRRLNPQIARNTLFSDLRAESRYRDATDREPAIADALASADPAARAAHVTNFLKQQLSRVLKVPLEQLRADRTFKEMGFDSLMAIELRNRLEAGLAISLSSTLIWRYPTLDELARFALQLVNGGGSSEPVAAPASPRRTRWLVRERPNAAAKLRLFCFPHGGAGASAFHDWWQQFPDTVEICAFQPPGREERIDEAPERSMAAYAGAIADEIEPLLDLPFAVFGYSLGGLTGFAALAELRRRTGREPRHLFVSSCFAPHIPFAETTLGRVSTQQSALQAMAFYRSTPDSIFRDPEMQALLQRSMDADNAVVESYRFGDERPLDCPITAYAGRADDLAPLHEQQRWRELTRGGFELQPFDGDHFFFLRDKQPVLADLRRHLLRIEIPS